MERPSDILASEMDDEVYEQTWKKRCDVIAKAWVQYRYHRRRQRFFDLIDKWTKAITIVLGASLMGQFVKDSLPQLSAAITSLGLLALVFGYGDRKQVHKEFAEASAALIVTIEQVPAVDMTRNKVAAWAAEHVRICAKAPPPMKTLTILCEIEQAKVDGSEHIPKPWFLWRWLADFKS